MSFFSILTVFNEQTLCLPCLSAAAEQRHRVRVLSGGVPSAAGGVLVPVLLLLSAVPGGAVVPSGPDSRPAHRDGLFAAKGEWWAEPQQVCAAGPVFIR